MVDTLIPNNAELERLLVDLESDRVERKSSASDPDRIRRTICAFANDLPNHGEPGVIFVGATDGGECANLDITDKMMKQLSDFGRDGSILPTPSMAVEIRSIHGCKMAVISVLPSDYPPVRYKGRVWVRVGPSTRHAEIDDERCLTEKRRSTDLPFDHRFVRGATIEDLDTDFFQRTYLRAAVAENVLQENNRPLERQLISLRCLSKEGLPTCGAILLFGKDPLEWIPGAYVQFVRFDGKAITDPIKNQKSLSGPLYEIIFLLEELVNINISVSTDLTSAVEIEVPDYPVQALRQLLRNAVMHRSYESTNAPVRVNWFSDRVEILSPGGLYGQVNKENFGKGATDYRNPLVAEGMRVLGYIQRFGVGIPLVWSALHENGNPPPEFSFETGVAAIVRKRG